MTDSRDAAEVVFVQVLAMGEHDHLQARDPAVTGAGCSDLRDARRSILPAGRPGAVKSVSLPDVSSRSTTPAEFARSADFRGG